VLAARQRNPALRLVVIDPRRTATAEAADLHLPLRPGSDVALFNGLLAHLARSGRTDTDFVTRHTEGLEVALAAAQADAPSLDHVAEACSLAIADVARFFEWVGETERTVTLYSQGVNQSASGTDKVNAIINTHLLTGRIGRAGMGPFSLTGQPNAMGGREVGGLANQLAAHLRFNATDLELLSKVWKSPSLARRPGLKAVDMFEAVATGKIKAIWIMATNPVVSLPDADRVRDALARCEFVVVSDCVRDTDTTRHADVLLPALAWGEKDGTVTNSERRISRQRAVLPPPGEAKPDWWIVTEIARRLGFGPAFTYLNAAEIFREHASLSGAGNDGARLFDISGLAQIDDEAYEALAPVQWPVTPRRPAGTPRLFGDGHFAAGGGRFVAVRARPTAAKVDESFPLALNTGRVRDQWHTMTRTGPSPRLAAHVAEPFIAIHPDDARAAGIADATLMRVASVHGQMTARAQISTAQRPGEIFAPMHWNDRFSGHARVGATIAPAVDPVSGQPELKHTPVRVTPLNPAWSALLLSRDPIDVPGTQYWARAAIRGGWRHELAGHEAPGDWEAWARALIGFRNVDSEWIVYRDPRRGLYRAAVLQGQRLESCLYVAGDLASVSRDWLIGVFERPTLSAADRRDLLAGRPIGAGKDPGAMVCACFAVGRNAITEAIASQGLRDVDAIGVALKAGTNCGSCRPELAAMLRAARPHEQRHTEAAD
jgi:assimilatory nitrate reductase catalytic subunit